MPAISRAVNYWPDNKCARLFWAQHEWPPYQKLLADTVAWLEPQPGGRFIFSVNTRNPSWIKIALLSFTGFFTAQRPLRYFQKSWALFRFGGWLKDEAQRGRFHYLPRTAVVAKLRKAGFTDIQRRR